MSKYIITVAPPTPNGNLHLGHIAGPFLAADVFNKVMRLLKHETIFVCYSDDYQDYVVRKSLENSIDRFDWATKFADQIGATLEKTEIALDWFMKAYNNPYFKESVKFFYENACAKDNISTVNTSVPYSLEDDVYGYEAFARGTCNYCGAESDPSQCEECANSPNIEKMGELVSIISKKPMVFVEKEREFFKLGNYTDFLERLYRTSFARIELKEFVSNAIENCNLDWFIDRPDGNGIELTLHGTQKIIHTWFSGMAGYYAATQEYSESIGNSSFWREFWTSPET
ncbi:MAG: methionine--tRNA ligase, partial [Sphingobacteriales bacterium]